MIAILTGLAVAAAPLPANVDPDTRAWWATTAALSGDAMEGRDTGSAAYERAAKLVAQRFAKAGLKPAGEKGGWFQPVPMGEIAVTKASVTVGGRGLRFLHDIYLSPAPGMATAIDAPIAFRGYCGKDALGEVRGKAVVCWGARRAGLPGDAERVVALKAAGAAAYVMVADPGFTVEPPRWPYAYARTLWNEGSAPAAEALPKLTLNAAAFGKLIAGSGQDAGALAKAGIAGAPLAGFEVPARLSARFTLSQRKLVSQNVIGLLPGTDPASARQAIALTAHLDGYGYGEAVGGDRLYNGTLDDAAYVALLVRLAERRAGKGFRRPVLFTVVTGEEKGLLGSRWFVAHPTVPLSDIAADINLDQLRPIFPLELLTVHALDDTTLGDDVRAVAGGMGIAVQHDPEPERNLLRRSDNWPFMQAGVPATGFVFGYKPGTESERIYRRWYVTGYHRPQDDLVQPMDWKAATDFNRFFYRLVDRVADQAAAPGWKAGSALKPK
jgi:Zn-dependent M28 family amino/carboxypeptidase